LRELASSRFNSLDHCRVGDLARQIIEHLTISHGLAGRAAQLPPAGSEMLHFFHEPAFDHLVNAAIYQRMLFFPRPPQDKDSAFLCRSAVVELQLLVADRLARRSIHLQSPD